MPRGIARGVRAGRGVLATLKNGNSGHERRLIAVDALYEAPAAGGHVVDKFRLMESQPVEINHVQIGAQARHQPTAIRQTEKVGGFAGLPFDQILDGQPWPAVSVAPPVRKPSRRTSPRIPPTAARQLMPAPRATPARRSASRSASEPRSRSAGRRRSAACCGAPHA
jgi:hypothetical protein